MDCRPMLAARLNDDLHAGWLDRRYHQRVRAEPTREYPSLIT
jgi:hypothetical protein